MERYNLADYQYFYGNSTPQYGVCKYCGTSGSINGRIRDDHFKSKDPQRWNPQYIKDNRFKDGYSAYSDYEKEMSKCITHNCLDCWFNHEFSLTYKLTESSFDYSETMLKKYTYQLTKKKFWKQIELTSIGMRPDNFYYGKVIGGISYVSDQHPFINNEQMIRRIGEYRNYFKYGWWVEIINKETNQKRSDWLFFDQSFIRSEDILRNYIDTDIDPFLEKLFRLAGHENVEVFDASKLEVNAEEIPLITVTEHSLQRFAEIIQSYEDNLIEGCTVVKQLKTENLRLINELNSNSQPSSLTVFLFLIFIILMLGGVIHWIIRKIFGKRKKF